MKKYKLIKEYPTSPELNTIVTELPHGIGLYQDKNYYRISKNEIENYPEFWELVVEKDYEILSFKALKNSIWKKRNDGFWAHDGGYCDKLYTEENMLTNSLCSIHSVKRLSDGEVFTIGDNIVYFDPKRPDYKSNDKGIINKFSLNNDYIIVYYGSKYSNMIIHIQHSKQPLFKTEDGVDLFENDEYYTIFDDKYRAKPYNVITFGVNGPFKAIDDDDNPYDRNVKYFSTKKAAENWIKCHKPVLTLNEVLDIIKNEDDTDSMKTKLTKLVKEKLHKS